MDDNPYQAPQTPPPARDSSEPPDSFWRRLAYGPIFHPLEGLLVIGLLLLMAFVLFLLSPGR